MCLCDIILYSRKNSVPLSDIVRRERIPKVYIKRILSELVKAGILKSRKGARGGFLLNKRPKDISIYTLYEIFSSGAGEKTDLIKVKNKKVGILLEETRDSVDKQFIDILKSIRFNILLKRSRQKKKKNTVS